MAIFSPQLISQVVNYEKYYPTINFPLSNNNLPFSNYGLKTSNEIIKTDSIIANSIQGTGTKILFKYDDKNQITEWSVLGNYGSGWYSSEKHERDYDEHGNILTEVYLSRYNTSWDTLERIDYYYKLGMLSQTIRKSFINNSWTNVTRSSYIFGSNNNLLTRQTDSWNIDNWLKKYLVSYYYSSKSKNDSILFKTWGNNGWQSDRKTIFYYSKDGLDLDSLIAKIWDGNSWSNLIKDNIDNDDSHNQIEQYEKIWDNGAWLNSIRRFFSYNKANYITEATCVLWNGIQWHLNDGDLVIHNPDGFSIGFITNKISIYYSDIVNVSNENNSGISSFSLSQNYPNPFNPTTIIKYEIPKASFVKIKVFDILGKEVATLVNGIQEAGNHKVQFNSSNLSSGIYFYRLTSGNFTQIKKMILLK